MAKAKRTGTASVYQLKVTLRHIKPPIWRRILVPGNTKLSDLHLMLQAAMGWANGHLHMFTIDGIDYSARNPEFDDDMEDEKKFRLDKVVSHPKARFRYVYDFGDNWEHLIVVEQIMPPESGSKYPMCIAGKRACPPEDCGSIPGYENLLAALSDPKHEEHEEMLEWIGGKFDPEKFDLEVINESLADYKGLDWEAEL
jgi:hypothetical protein